MRLILVPVWKANWAYFCHSTAKPTGRVAQWVTWSVTKWEDLGKQPHRSVKKRLHDAGTKVIDRMEHEEAFLKSVPAVEDISESKTRVPFYFPSILSLPEVQERFKTHVSKRQAHHKRYMIYSVAFLPVSGLFTIVPLIPNIPFFYNVYRLYSHYKAYKGAQHLTILSEQDRIQFISDGKLDCAIQKDDTTEKTASDPPPVHIEGRASGTTRHRNGTGTVSNSTSIDPKSTLQSATVDAASHTPGSRLEKETIDEECVRKIGDIFRELFPVLEAELRKARFQVLEREKKNIERPTKE